MAEPRLASVEQLKVPPHSIEAEQSVLGGILLAERGFEEVADRISEEDFYREDHRLIYRAICELNDLGSPLDAVTVTEWFENNGHIDRVDGGAYIVQLTNTTPSAANITAYADIVREKSILRSLIDVGTLITSKAFGSEGRNSKELLEEAEKAIFAIADRGQRAGQGFVSVQDTLDEAFKRIEELVAHEGDITGIPTGFLDFDRKTAGLQDSDLVIVAGRPAMGKTTLAMNIAENAAIKSKVPVAVFSMEMSSLQLVMRLFSSLGQIEQGRLRTGNLDDLDWPKLTSAMNILRRSKIFIDETPALSPSELRARARRLKREHDIGMIVIDYLQLMQVPGNNENRANEIAEISRSLKALAKELHLPVIALSQLNRSLEQRPNKRPIMADLRESGSIEQDADLIVFIYRDEVYNEDSPAKGKAEIIIGKHRHGSTGTVELNFQGPWLRFANLAPDYFQDEGLD
ncbi:MAG: replicative DNA helicase [Xanthomonadales bacterium]|jgi:replicative DNA helicase|nr:replicative DNA helicase [Xanthomonadales bacterium]